ncbi:MAG: UDP-N-acetylmuramate dehydrogenase [Patescibacteria group bacterium]
MGNINIQEGVRLAPFTTFGIGGEARYFVSVQNEEEISEAVTLAEKMGLPIFVLGGGSNILVSDRGFQGVVIKNDIKEITFDEKGEEVIATVGAGEVWDDFVQEAVTRGLFGIENLSGIPGSVGAGPIQNIGAYGQEISTTLKEVWVFDTKERKIFSLSKDECEFFYRESIFKKKEGKRFIILRVVFSLQKNGQCHILHQDLSKRFEKEKIILSSVREAVLSIRSTKLLDWKMVGNAGSFFKNPFVEDKKVALLQEQFPNLTLFRSSEGKTKISAGFLIERLVAKEDRTLGGAEISPTHSLVIANISNAKSEEVKKLGEIIQKIIFEKTGIHLEREVQFIF